MELKQSNVHMGMCKKGTPAYEEEEPTSVWSAAGALGQNTHHVSHPTSC